MGYLDNTTITVEAILTKKGRALLASGQGLQISQFAVSDDEVDYALWAPEHPLGSAFYGAIIEGMPLTEAVPDETQVMRYKLVTLPKGTNIIPFISFAATVLTYTAGQASQTLPAIGTSAGTTGFTGTLDGPGFGYTVVLFDTTGGMLSTSAPLAGTPTLPAFLGDIQTATAQVIVGTGGFAFLPVASLSATVSTRLTVIGNQTGATLTIPFTVNPAAA